MFLKYVLMEQLKVKMFNTRKNKQKDTIPEIDFNIQGVPKNTGIQRRIRYRLCYELAL